VLYVYTSVVDGFDNLRPPACPPDHNVRFICFTNVPNLPRVFPWEYRPIYPVGEPCRTARVAKILSHLMLPEDAEYSIYHDGNFQLRMDPNRMIDELLRKHQWASYRHPCRTCVYEEGDLLLREKIGNPTLVAREIQRYQDAGFPREAGLWANGLLVRRHTPEVAALNEQWWKLYSVGCERDQLSFPVARRDVGMKTNTIDGDIWQSPYILFRWHAAWKDKDDNPDHWEARDRQRRRLEQLKAVTGSCGGVAFQPY